MDEPARTQPAGGGRVSRPIPLYLFSTYCRFSGSSLFRLAADLEPSGFRMIASRSFKCPSNGIASLQEAEDFEYRTVMYFENRIDLKLDRFVDTVMRRIAEPGTGMGNGGSGFLDSLKINIVGKVEKARYPSLTVDEELCTRCGLCARNCPEGNLVLTDEGIRILDPKDCLHCLRCMHRCPSRAVSFGELTRGPNRYTKKIRDELFSRAVHTPLDDPEPGTSKIKRRWAKERPVLAATPVRDGG